MNGIPIYDIFLLSPIYAGGIQHATIMVVSSQRRWMLILTFISLC
jgi:predicted branched-subunit amino acid permease